MSRSILLRTSQIGAVPSRGKFLSCSALARPQRLIGFRRAPRAGQLQVQAALPLFPLRLVLEKTDENLQISETTDGNLQEKLAGWPPVLNHRCRL